jgi:hypothetical protein
VPTRRLDYAYQRPAHIARGRVLQGDELGGSIPADAGNSAAGEAGSERRSFESSVLGLKPDAASKTDAVVKTAGGEVSTGGVQPAGSWTSRKTQPVGEPAALPAGIDPATIVPLIPSKPTVVPAKTTGGSNVNPGEPQKNEQRGTYQPAPRAPQSSSGWKSAQR